MLAALAVCFTAIAVPAGVAAAASTSVPQAAPGSIGLRLLGTPAVASDDPRAQIYIVDHVAPGAVIARRIELSNTTATAANIVLYPAAATIANGSFLGADGHTRNDLSTWTSVDPSASDVTAGGSARATVTITVPSDASPGEQYGVVWAEVRSTPAAAGGITQVSRVGIRLYVDVGPGGPPASNFTIDSLTAGRSPDGRPTVVAAVHNTGGRALDMSGTLQLAGGPGGLSAGPFPADLGVTLAIGDTEPVTIALDRQVPAGPWDAEITLHSGLLDRNARATLTFPATGASPSVSTSSTQHGWLATTIAGLAVLLLGLGALFVVRSRGRRRPTNSAT